MSSCVPIQYLPPSTGRLMTETARPSGVSTMRFIASFRCTEARISARYFSGSMLRLPVEMRLRIRSRNVQPGFTISGDRPYIST